MPVLPHHLSREVTPKLWVLARALEWFALPAFISQPLLPFLLCAFPRWELVVIAYCADLLWRFVCHMFVNIFISRLVYFVWRLRWISAILSSVFLFRHDHTVLACVALLWPIASTWLSVTTTYIARAMGTRANLATVEARFARSIGLVEHTT